MKGVVIQPLRHDYLPALSVETLEEFVRKPPVALRLTFICCQIVKTTLHQGGEGGVALGGPRRRARWCTASFKETVMPSWFHSEPR
jgi:hypothetical protein